MATYRELLAQVKGEIDEISTIEAHERLESSDGSLFVDVREPDEWDEGHIPGAIYTGRGRLEQRIEGLVPDKSRPLVVYCSAGSPLGVRGEGARGARLRERRQPRRRVLRLEAQRLRGDDSRASSRPSSARATAGTCSSRRSARTGSSACSTRASCSSAQAGSALPRRSTSPPPESGRSASSTPTSSTSPTSSARSSTRPTGSASRRSRPRSGRSRRSIPTLRVVPFQERLTSENVDRILADGWDVIVDGADNFPTRYLVNDASVWSGIPVVHGSIFRFEGQVTVFAPGVGPCYRCLFPQPPPPELAPSCAEGGVLGVLPGIIGSIQANETLKLILDRGDSLAGRLLLFDALGTTLDEVDGAPEPRLPGVRRQPDDHRVRRLRRVLQRAGAPLMAGGSHPAHAARRGRRRARARGRGRHRRRGDRRPRRALSRRSARSSCRTASSRRS